MPVCVFEEDEDSTNSEVKAFRSLFLMSIDTKNSKTHPPCYFSMLCEMEKTL